MKTREWRRLQTLLEYYMLGLVLLLACLVVFLVLSRLATGFWPWQF